MSLEPWVKGSPGVQAYRKNANLEALRFIRAKPSTSKGEVRGRGVAFGLSNNIVNGYVPAHAARNTRAASANHVVIKEIRSSDKELNPPSGEAGELYKGRMIEAEGIKKWS